MKCGVGDYTDVLVSYLSDIGIDVDVLTSANREVVRNDQIKPIITNWGLSCIKEIFKYCKSNNINIVHIQYPTKGYGYKIGTNLLPLFNKIIKIFRPINYALLLRFMNLVSLISLGKYQSCL